MSREREIDILFLLKYLQQVALLLKIKKKNWLKLEVTCSPGSLDENEQRFSKH